MDKNQPLNPKPKVSITSSPIDHEWVEIVGTTKDPKSSNSTKVKLVKVLNKFGVTHIVVNTSQTSTVGSTNCPPPLLNLMG
jgi:hypothetical protein